MKVNIALHVFLTWLVAHLLHPLLFVISAGMLGDNEAVELVMLVFFYGILFSIPALFAGMLVVFMIVRLPVKNTGLAAVLWLLSATGSILGCGYFLLMGGSIFGDGFLFILPAILSCLIAILVRINQFERLFISWKTASTSNETYEA